MSEFVALRALLFMGELLAASGLLLSLAWIASRHIRQASVRHFVWTTAFGALLMFPILTAIAPAVIHILLPAHAPEIPTAALLTSQAMATPVPHVSAASWPHVDLQTIAFGIGALWLAGAAAVLIHGVIGALRLRVLKRQSSAYALAPADLPNVSATRRECELRLSDAQHGPMTWGVFRPVILLPKAFLFWPRERRHAVLLHELAHIRRRDSLVHVLSLFVSALYWPIPLVWIGARAMRRDAEIAADDAVIASGVKPSAYAKELLQLASEFRVQLAFSGTSFSMAAHSALESRLKSVLARNPVRSGVTKMDVLKILGAALLATTALALARPSLAEEAPQPPDVTAEAPPVPDVPPAPPAPPAPPVSAALPQPPAPSIPEVHVKSGLDVHIYRKLTPEERAHIRAIARKAQREAEAAIAKAQPDIDWAVAKVQPEIDRALAHAARIHLDEDRMRREIARAQPQIEAALKLAHSDLSKAHLDAKIRAKIDEALRHAQAKLHAGSADAGNADMDIQDAGAAADGGDAQ